MKLNLYKAQEVGFNLWISQDTFTIKITQIQMEESFGIVVIGKTEKISVEP
jgi:hypothetical protein